MRILREGDPKTRRRSKGETQYGVGHDSLELRYAVIRDDDQSEELRFLWRSGRACADMAERDSAARAWTNCYGRSSRRVESATHSGYPDAGQLPTQIDRALRLLILLPVLIRNDQGESDGQA